MIDDINKAISDYKMRWQHVAADRKNKEFFTTLTPTAVGWKVADVQEFDQTVAKLRDHCTEVLMIFMNQRWVAKCVLRENLLHWNIPIIKIMQIRPDSHHALGLDHLDFYGPGIHDVEAILKDEPNLKWTEEHNGEPEYPSWFSVWFDGTEAKLKPHTVLDISIMRLQALSNQIKEVRG